jgi:hypothetical protein
MYVYFPILHCILKVEQFFFSGNKVAAALEAISEESTIPNLSYTVRP